MKINIIGTSLFLSGGMRIIFEYGNRLTERGHDVCFYYPYIPYKFAKDPLLLQLKRKYWSVKDYLLNKKRIINSYNCNFQIKGVPYISDSFLRNADVAIATQWPTAFDVNKLSLSKGRKFYFLQDYEIWGSNKDKVEKALKLDLKKITISKYNEKFFLDNFNINTYVILNGIDFKKFDVLKKSTNKNKVITFIEHPLEDKGVEIAIEVIKKLHNDNANLDFICFGHDKYHNIPDFVKFFSNPNDTTVVNDILGKTDIFIYPSLKEGFALPPAEAMACKCAVVTTNVGAIPEYSVHGTSALHVTPNSPDEMYEAVSFLLNNEDEITRISENAYTDIRKVLDWNSSVDKFEKFIM